MDKEKILLEENNLLKQQLHKLETILSKKALQDQDNIQKIEKLSNIIENLQDENKKLLEKKQRQKHQLQIYQKNSVKLKQLTKELKNKNLLLEEKISTILTKNKQFSKTLVTIINDTKSLKDYITNAKKNIDLSDIKVESKVSLKGKFIGFCFETNSLEIQIHNETYFYSLSEYKCKYLPLYNSRVFIFTDNDSNIQIYGLKDGQFIEEAPIFEFQVKSISISTNKVKLYNNKFGFIDVTIKTELLSSIRLSQTILLKQSVIDEDFYFTLVDNNLKQYDPNEIIKHIKEQ